MSVFMDEVRAVRPAICGKRAGAEDDEVDAPEQEHDPRDDAQEYDSQSQEDASEGDNSDEATLNEGRRTRRKTRPL